MNPIKSTTQAIFYGIIAICIIIGSSLALQCHNAQPFTQLPAIGHSVEYKMVDTAGERRFISIERMSDDSIWIHAASMGLNNPMEINQQWSASFTTEPAALGFDGRYFYHNPFENFCASRIEVDYINKTIDVYVYIDSDYNHLTVPRHYHLVQ